MKKDTHSPLLQVVFTHFVPCLFLGVTLLYIIDAIAPAALLATLSNGMFKLDDLAMAVVLGGLVAILVWGFHTHRNQRLRKRSAHPRHLMTPNLMAYALGIGFISGVLDVILILHNEGIIVLTVLVLVVLAWHLHVFNQRIINMLRPRNIATWDDVFELMRIYLTMLAGFTLINATLEGMHMLAGSTVPFGFAAADGEIFLNALYYTVVTMTTLGFGDIVPLTWDGKLLLIIQCLISYFMFALMVGIVTRGVIPAHDTED